MTTNRRAWDEDAGKTHAHAVSMSNHENDGNSNGGGGGGSRRRLMITKMELENFKSYAGRKVIGPFHPNFSSVVGPNGSGKSNVIDAMLFVFGRRAKQLRLSKAAELIHCSSDYPDLDYATVHVHFAQIEEDDQNENNSNNSNVPYTMVPDSAAVVSRTVKKENSSSHYALNGRTVPFTAIASFLAQHGIDLNNNRFLILQGEVEMISMMPPRGKSSDDAISSSSDGLLEYLEDLIGSATFVPATLAVAAAVEQLTEARTEKLSRCKVAQQEVAALATAKAEAESLLQCDRNLRALHNVLYQMQAVAVQNEHDKLAEQRTSVATNLQTEQDAKSSAQSKVTELETALATQQAEYDVIAAELTQTSSDFAAYERKDIKLREELKYGKAQRKKLELKVAAEEAKAHECVEKQAAAADSIPGLERDVARCAIRQQDHDDALDAMQEELQGVTLQLRTQLEAQTNELAPVQQDLAEYQAHLDTAQTQVKLLENATQRAKAQLVAAETELASLDATQASQRDTLAAAADELHASRDRLHAAEDEHAMLGQKETQLAARNKELMAKHEFAKVALATNAANGKRRPPAVQSILDAARDGGALAHVGVLGRLGDLARIPEQYDVAVSTAAAGMLDAIVTHTTAGAQKCLQYLRAHNLGRATFVPLDKMPKGAHDRAVATPEEAPRLFDVLDIAHYQVVAPALYRAVSNTLVAPDLATATRWAFDFGQRWRVVTLDGKLIEASGTMSGGGHVVRKGGMKLLVPSNAAAAAAEVDNDDDTIDSETKACQKLEHEASNAQQLLLQLRQRRTELAAEIKDLKKTIKALEVKVPKLEMEIAGCDTTRENLTARLPALQKQTQLSAADAAKLATLQGKVESCKADMASCAARAAELQAEVERLQGAILDAGGAKLKKQEAACKKALADLNKAEKALSTAKVTVSTMEKAAQKAQDAKVAAETALKDAKAALEEKKAEFKQLEEDAFAVVQAFDKLKALANEKRIALDEATQELDDLKAAQSKDKYVEIELQAKLDMLEKQLADCTKKQQHWADQLDKLRRAAVEDDDDLDASVDEDEEAATASGGGVEETKDGAGDSESNTGRMDVRSDTDEAANSTANQNVDAASKSSSALPILSEYELRKYDKHALKEDIVLLETERATIAKNANMGAIAEYRRKEADYLARVAELDTVTEERNAKRKEHEELRRKRLEMFMDGFGKITLKLKEMYQMITLGGDAELELVDSLDPFSEGIVFSVRPPKKSWKNISNLSGGEKTLSSLALVFALHHFKPTPLYVMDEIDAALDFKNVSIVANYIKERTKDAQFVIISLRNNMFELADRLVGIYKTNNATKSVTINPHAFGVQGEQKSRDGNRASSQSQALTERTNAPPASAEDAHDISAIPDDVAGKSPGRRSRPLSTQSAAEGAATSTAEAVEADGGV